MKVRDRMTRSVTTVRADGTLRDASCAMRDADVGMLGVNHNDRLAGVITDRDIVVRAIAQGHDPADAKVAEFMSRDLAGCYDDDEAEVAAGRMRELRLRRLLVVDRDKKPVGVVSLGDLATHGACAGLAQEALSGICQPTA